MKTVLIADCLGTMPSDHLRNEYPNAVFEVIEEAPTNDPHGEMVCESFLKGHGKDQEVKILIYPYIQLQTVNPYGFVDVIEAYDPDLFNGSFGAWDNDQALSDTMLEMMWMQSTKAKQIPGKLGSTNVFFASGNFNQKWDTDEDLAWPGKGLMHLPNVFLVGSASREGFPAESSSDGPRIFCMAWGENQRLWNPLLRKYVWISGTSFASPLVCGMMARDFGSYRFNSAEAYDWVLDRVTVANGWKLGDRHPVAGFGDLTTFWEKTK